MRNLVRLAVVPSLAVCLLATARAHEDEGLDLATMVELVGVRIPETVDGDRKVHRAYVGLGRTLGRPSDGLADDVKRLGAVSRACGSSLNADGELRGLLDDALAAAEAALTDRPSEVETHLAEIGSVNVRRKPEAVAVKARAAFLAGRHLLASDEAAALVAFRRAARGFDQAEDRAVKAVARQGGPAPQTLAPVPGDVYTVIGTGEGGYNGDGREARRSDLYWVEKIRLGPDGRLYILDWNNHMLRRREADGTLTRLAGRGVPRDSEGPALQTDFNHPSAAEFLPDGRILIAAWHNHKIKVYDPTGVSPVVYTIAGGPQGNTGEGGPATAAKFNLVPGVLLLPDGDVLLTDAGNACVRKVTLGTAPVTAVNVAGTSVTTGTVARIWGTGTAGYSGDNGPASAAQLGFSKAQNAESDGRMARDAAGNVFLVNGVMHVIRRVALDGTITTVAGNGTPGFSGDGGLATAARLNFPADVAVAADGTLFVSDQFNHCIRRVAPDGTISTVAGVPGEPGYDGDEGPAATAHLRRPTGLELDGDGNLYFCDKDNSVVRVIASAAPGALVLPVAPYRLPGIEVGGPPEPGPSGTIDTYAGTGNFSFNGDGRPALETDFYWPQDVSVNPVTGLLYVVDWNNHRIRRVEANGTVAAVSGVGQLGDTNGPALEVRMNHPTDVTFHPATGDLYIAGWHVDKVKKVDSSTNVLSAVNKPDGRRAFTGDDGDVSLAEMNLPASVKFDVAGNLYVADEGNTRVRRVDAITRVITTIAGTGVSGFSGDDGPGTLAQLNLPNGQSAQPAGRVCVDPTNAFLYIADTDNHRVRRLALGTGTITTVAGNGTPAFAGDGALATAASLQSPTDVDCDAAGNLYICDRDNHAVRKVTLSTGVITTVAGSGVSGYAGDTGPATGAKLQSPSGIFVDRANGRLYVADTLNSVVRVVWE